MVDVSVKVEPVDNTADDDELDDIPIMQRLKRLRSTSKIESRPIFLSPLPINVNVKKEEADDPTQAISVGSSPLNVNDIGCKNTGERAEQNQLFDRQISNVRNDSHETAKDNSSILKISSFDSISDKVKNQSCMNLDNPQKGYDSQESLSSESGNCLSQITNTKCEPPFAQELVPSDANNTHVPSLPAFPVTIKSETLESVSESPCANFMGTSQESNNVVAVKSEMGTSYEDTIDHMPLRQRKELLIAKRTFNLETSKNLKCLRKSLPSTFECNSNPCETSKAEGLIRRRKKKKTATDSIEAALEEDAPGLLKVLVEKGIIIDEIKLYGDDFESGGALDELSEEDSFGDLESVVSKLFSQKTPLFKLPTQHSKNISRPSYCLACLLSLVEQTRYLLFRNWPVEWGWCRDLQSFIFVFERHNRIVLERPEYGYATYFFELVDSLPIDWQIKRLVTAMKLSSCSRTTLIENRPLLVGEDLSEGEARVLEDYGWTPNTGLGSMLSYCDRVVHDRKNEADDVSDWRSKIGKLLMKGFDGGTVILSQLPKKYKGYTCTLQETVHVEPLK